MTIEKAGTSLISTKENFKKKLQLLIELVGCYVFRLYKKLEKKISRLRDVFFFYVPSNVKYPTDRSNSEKPRTFNQNVEKMRITVEYLRGRKLNYHYGVSNSHRNRNYQLRGFRFFANIPPALPHIRRIDSLKKTTAKLRQNENLP